MKSLILEVRTGARRNAKLVLAPGKVAVIGRTELADFVVPDESALASRHYSLQWDGRTATLEELRGARGTEVDGLACARADLRHGAWLRVGRTDFTVHFEGHTAPRPEEAGDEDVDLEHLEEAWLDAEAPAGTPFATETRSPALAGRAEPAGAGRDETRSLIAELRVARRLTLRAANRRRQMAEAALRELSPIAERGELHVVLDSANTPRIRTVLRECIEEADSLYEGGQAAALEDVAPMLLKPMPASRVLAQIVDEGWGRRWGIFIEGTVPTRDLRRHLRRFLMVEAESGQKLYFRYYDPICLLEFWPTCTRRQREELCGPARAYLVEDENGAMVRLDVEGVKSVLTDASSFRKVG